MGPPLIQGVPAVPKMGVRARVSDRSQRREEGDVQPLPRSDSLIPRSLNGPPGPNGLLETSLDQQTGSETRLPVCDRRGSPSPPRRTLSRMKRSNSEVTISNAGDDGVDAAAVNPNTGASLRRAYGSTSTLDPYAEAQEPSAPPSEPPHPHASIPMARRDLIQKGLDQKDGPVCSTDQELMLLAASRQSSLDVRFSVTPHKCFSHYDVQSVLLGIGGSSFPHGLRTDSRASAASRCSDSSAQTLDRGEDLDASGEADDGKSSSLVVSNPFFCNEIGGEAERTLGLTRVQTAGCSGGEAPLAGRRTNAGVSILEGCRETQAFPPNVMNNCGIEYVDRGASYYLKYFYSKDHHNYFGFDESFGPVSLSVRREKLDNGTQYNYRIILRTSQVFTLRGSILEDSIPSSSKHGTSRGLPLKDVLEFMVPELKVESLRRASSSPRVPELLLQLDQQELSFQFSVDVLCCRTAEDQIGGPALEQFLNLLAHKVPLEGFANYQGSHSVYTKFRDFDLKFVASALQPRTVNDTQQLLHDGHIRNVVTVVFQEPEDPPFDPQIIHSHLHRVFIVVRVHRPCSQHTCYSVAVSRCRGVPSFGPLIPSGWMFPASPAFRDFLLTKIINAQHAVSRSDTFVAMATCSRKRRLEELVGNFSTSMPVESSSSTRFSFNPFGGKKKERSARCTYAHLQSAGALTWGVTVPDFGRSAAVTCRLAISSELVALIQEDSRQVVFSCLCRDVIGWSSADRDVKLFYQHGNCLVFSAQGGRWEDVHEITYRLQLVTSGAAAVEMTLRRNLEGQLGFHVNFEGIVADVEARGCAWEAGLRPGCRLVEICSVALVTLSHEQMIELLRRSAMVSVVVIPARGDGTPRRSFSETFRVPMFSDATYGSLQVAPPTWHHVAVAPPTSRVPSNQSAGSAPEQQLSALNLRSMFSVTEGAGPSTSIEPQLIHRRAPDWPISYDESTLERSRRWKSDENKYHHQPAAVMKVLRQFELSDSESSVRQHRVSGKSCSSYSNSNTLSSSGSETHPTRHTGVSLDSGIDSALCASSAPPPVPSGTLVLRDVWREGQPGGIEPKAPPCHPMERSESCCLFRDSPEASFTPTRGSTQEKLLPLEERSLEVNRLSRCSIREECVKLMQFDASLGTKSSVLPSSPWRSLTRSLSEDSLYRTLSRTGSRTSLLSDLLTPSDAGAPPTLRRNKLHHSESSLAERGRTSLSRGSAQFLWKQLRDVTQTFRAAGLFSELRRLSHAAAAASESSALQDSNAAAPSLSGKVVQLEEVLQRLQFDLLQEQQDKAALQQQVQSLRQDNLRLQEESQTTAEQIRRFAHWMLHRGASP
ncbi:signal-induced proliferation-associated 1-like protein 2 [Salarias fasciatus]|uniref:signal-induced proliferation-associated 1-like protein 2 n=1 Tax=Salarias fasciatus TaxID=181472 RepID=UPI001176E3E1|nr:signal-induced proliferation-associated 1-like protein 2 [Salarias fasciatus]